MAFFDDIVAGISNNPFTTLATGASLLMVTPLVAPVLGQSLRWITKTVIWGGVMVYDLASSAVAEVGEQVSDLAAEVRQEMGKAVEHVTEDSAERPRTGGQTLVLDAQGQPV